MVKFSSQVNDRNNDKGNDKMFSPSILNDIGNLKDKIVDFAQDKLRKEEARR